VNRLSIGEQEVDMPKPSPSAFDLGGFVEDCRGALAQSPAERAVRDVVARAVSEPASILRALGEPTRAEIQKLHHSPDLTVLNVIWAPRMNIMPHDHRMWAVIGIYSGREDNVFWRRIRDDPGGKIEAAGSRALENGDAFPLGRDIVHSVTNPLPRFTCALHVYGGDFFATARSEWDPGTLLEQPYDVSKALRMFEQANQRDSD
jgi:predicted metal-dependent enzyme (double-stranded beta helix superfamily)